MWMGAAWCNLRSYSIVCCVFMCLLPGLLICAHVWLSCVCLCAQPWEGDITLVLPSHMWNLGKSIVNPTTNDILSATRQVCVCVSVSGLAVGPRRTPRAQQPCARLLLRLEVLCLDAWFTLTTSCVFAPCLVHRACRQ